MSVELIVHETGFFLIAEEASPRAPPPMLCQNVFMPLSAQPARAYSPTLLLTLLAFTNRAATTGAAAVCGSTSERQLARELRLSAVG